jgi:hypothetical protein
VPAARPPSKWQPQLDTVTDVGCVALQGLLGLATSELLEVGVGVGATARVLVGTRRYHDPVITDGWSGYLFERNQVRR